jgi:hypothetical protein
MNTASAHHRALPAGRLFSRRGHLRLAWLAAVPALIAAALPAALTATAVTAPPRPAGTPRGAAVLTAVTRPSAAQAASAYRIRLGDTLSGIAARLCGNPADYTGLAAANGIADPDLILAGATLWHVSCYRSAGTVSAVRVSGGSGGKVWGVSYGFPNFCGDGDGDGWDVACGTRSSAAPVSQAPASAPVQQAAPASSGGGGGGMSGSRQACIIARESGGNAQAWNPNGHYGLYQFSASTWAASGGNPADYGHASAAEQNQVFANAVASRGYSDWAPYDGC